MIKVCMVVHQYYDRDSRVRRYAESLASAGARVDVLSLREPGQRPVEERDGVRILSIPIGRRYKTRASYVMEYGRAFILFGIRLLELYARNRYHVIHINNMPDFLTFTALIPKLLGAQIILDIHDPMPEFYMSKYKGGQGSMAVRLMRLQERLSAGLAQAVITANDNFRKNLIARGIPADKITVVNNVADSRLFNRQRYAQEFRPPDDQFTLIYPGTIAPRYGLEVAIRALPMLVDQIPQLRLVIQGTMTQHAEELATLAEQLNVARFVEFREAVPVDQVPKHIAQAHIGIYTALPDAHMDIATPSKVLEYAMMGIPIVASRLKIINDLFGSTGVMMFKPGSSHEFASCILQLYQHPELRQEMVRNVDMNFVATHSWRYESQKYIELLNSLSPVERVALYEDIQEVQSEESR
ncbi:MAG: glycosyltransferase family 4 protein [Chloroflexi bacterium]|nr:glycosyltransferase family 4 protein [Chloroflexota bacterium]